MNLLKIFPIGLLPFNDGKTMAFSLPPLHVEVVDYNFNEIVTIPDFHVFDFSNNYLLLINDTCIMSFDIKSNNQVLLLDNTNAFTYRFDEYVLLNNSRKPKLELREMASAKVLWENELKIENRVVYGACTSSYFIGDELETVNKLCLDSKTGEVLWMKSINELSPNRPQEFSGINFIIEDTLMSTTSKTDFFGVDIATGKHKWFLSLGNVERIGNVLCEGKFYLFVMEGKKIYLVVMDCIEGKIIMKEDITDLVIEHKIYRKSSTGYFGQPCKYKDKLYFGGNNQLFSLNLETFQVKMEYTHDAVFYFSKTVGSKLFYSDDNLTTLAFELEDS